MSIKIRRKFTFHLAVYLAFGFLACNSNSNTKDKPTLEATLINDNQVIEKVQAISTPPSKATKPVDTPPTENHGEEGHDPIPTKLTSNLRPDQSLSLNMEYRDTLAFSFYDDDYDYWFLNGKKDGKPVSLIYNWDHTENEKYQFKEGDIIVVQWIMDRISQAGDEEIVDYRERALSAEIVKNI